MNSTVVRIAGALCLIVSASLAQQSQAQGITHPETRFPTEIVQSFSKAGIDREGWSAYALPLDPHTNRRPVAFGHNERDLMNPASVMKLLTTGYALEALGTQYQFRTQFLAAGDIRGGVLNGSLVIKGGGNPVYLTPDLWDNLRRVRAAGVQRITGNVVLDRTALLPPGQVEPVSEGEEFDEASYRAYHAQPDALLLNHGAMGLDIAVADGRVVVSAPDAPPGWTFVSNLSGGKGDCGAWKNNLNIQFKKQGTEVVVTVGGPYPLRCGNNRLPIRVAQQDWLWESWFREIWRQLGGEFSGQVVSGQSPAGAQLLYSHAGRALPELIKEVNKWSNNVMARHLELAVAKSQPEFESKIKAWLLGQRLGVQAWTLENGSGLSRTTRVDAKGLSEYLGMMAARPDFPDFFASFPRAGADGTLARRMKSVDQYAYLKTGSLNGVRSIGGYVRSKNGQMWAVVVMVRSPNAADSWDAMENLVKMLYNWGA